MDHTRERHIQTGEIIMQSYGTREHDTEYGILLDGILLTWVDDKPLVFSSKADAILYAHKRVQLCSNVTRYDIVHRTVIRNPFFLTTNTVN